MSIYKRAVDHAPQVDRRIVRAVDRVLASLPVPGGVFGRVDVWNALQANAKEGGVPMDLEWAQVGKALDALCLACILTCRGGAYSEVAEVPPLRAEAPAAPTEVEPAAVQELSPTLQAVIDILQAGPRSTRELCQALGCSESAVRSRTFRLRTQGLICEVGTVNTENHHGRVMTIWGLPLGTREVPSPAPAPEVVPPAPVKAEPWTARPKEGPDEAGRWRWEARATLETRVSRGLGWLAESEVLTALHALGPAETPPADEIAKLQAEIQAERAERRALWADVERLGAHVLRYDLMPLDFEGGAVDCAIALLTYQARSTGPEWPSLRNLDLDEAERAITEIERRCAAWRTLLAAARELAP